MMSFASALALFTWFVAVTHAQNYTCGTVVLRSDSDMSLFLRIDEDISTMYITITGTAGEFFGVGFGVSVMTDNTYAIIVDDATGVFEQLLDDGSAGTKITQGDIYLQSDETVDGVRTVLVSRPIFGADYSFIGTYSSSLDLIWARKTGGIFGPHAQGTNFRDSTSISFLSGLAEDDASCGAAIPTDMSGSSTTGEPGSGPDEVTSDPVTTMEDSSTMEPTMPETDLTTTAAPDDSSTSSPTADANEDAAMSLAGLICVARNFVFIFVLGALFVN